MPTPGYVFKDGQPIPDDEAPAQPRSIGQDALTKDTLVPARPGSVTDSTTSAGVHTPTSSKPSSNKLSYGVEAPTESHALAFEHEPEVKGAAQQHHFGTEVKDLGWNEHPSDVPKPLVGGLHNEDLWLLVRRFNRVCICCCVYLFNMTSNLV
jgi:hypothetical protein